MAIVWALCCLLTLPACSEFMEESLEEQQVSLLSPGEQAELSNYDITFRWEPTEHALHYQLQVASPGFEQANSYYADTLVEGLRFSISLEPGSYQWRLRALNGSSQSAYTTRSFILYEGALSRQRVLLNSPTANWLTNLPQLTLAWERLYAATRYQLQVDTANFQDEDRLVLNEELLGTSYGIQLERDGLYQWRVMAKNDTAASAWSEVHRFTLDTEPPAKAVPRSPADGANLALPVSLSWEGIADADHYLVYAFGSDGITPISSVYPARAGGTSHTFNTEVELGTRIIWRVRAVDAAGNEGEWSDARAFVVGL